MLAGPLAEFTEVFSGTGLIHFVRQHQIGCLSKLLAMQSKLLFQMDKIVNRIALIHSGHVDDKEEEAGTLNMPEEVVTQADPLTPVTPAAVIAAPAVNGESNSPTPIPTTSRLTTWLLGALAST